MGWYVKCRCWEVPLGRQDPAQGGSGSSLKSSAMGPLAQLLPRRTEQGRLCPKQGVSRLQPVGASRGLCDRAQGTPEAPLVAPGQLLQAPPFPHGPETAISCVPPQQPAGIQPALLPSLLPPTPSLLPTEIPGTGFVAAAFAAQHEVLAPQTSLTRQCPQQDRASLAARNPPSVGFVGLGQTQAG